MLILTEVDVIDLFRNLIERDKLYVVVSFVKLNLFRSHSRKKVNEMLIHLLRHLIVCFVQKKEKQTINKVSKRTKALMWLFSFQIVNDETAVTELIHRDTYQPNRWVRRVLPNTCFLEQLICYLWHVRIQPLLELTVFLCAILPFVTHCSIPILIESPRYSNFVIQFQFLMESFRDSCNL